MAAIAARLQDRLDVTGEIDRCTPGGYAADRRDPISSQAQNLSYQNRLKKLLYNAEYFGHNAVMRRALVLINTLWLAACIPPSAWDMPPIIGAARTGDTTAIERLLADGADPDVHAGVNNWTPLQHAIHKNQAGSIRVLLKHHADVNARANGGVTPLIMAAGYGYASIVRLLLDAGADAKLRANDGATALDVAIGGIPDIDRFTVGHCQTDTVRALLDSDPALDLGEERWSKAGTVIARFSGCKQVLAMLEERHKAVRP